MPKMAVQPLASGMPTALPISTVAQWCALPVRINSTLGALFDCSGMVLCRKESMDNAGTAPSRSVKRHNVPVPDPRT